MIKQITDEEYIDMILNHDDIDLCNKTTELKRLVTIKIVPKDKVEELNIKAWKKLQLKRNENEVTKKDLLEQTAKEVTKLVNELLEKGSEHYKEARRLLSDRNYLLDYVESYLENFIVGEKPNIELLYTCFINDHWHLIVRGGSSEGKTYLIKTTLRTIPDWRYKKIGGASPAAIRRFLSEKPEHIDIIYVQERKGVDESNQMPIRMTSKDDDGSTSLTSIKGESGNWETFEENQKPVTYITTTTESWIDPQDTSRAIELFVDDSQKQTRRITEFQMYKVANKINLKSNKKKENYQRKVLWTVYEILRKRTPTVVCPLYNNLMVKVPTNSVFMRRENKQIISVLENVTLMNYPSRVRVPNGSELFIISSLRDILDTIELFEKVDIGSAISISKSHEKLLKVIKSYYDANNLGMMEYISTDTIKLAYESIYGNISLETLIKYLRILSTKYLLNRKKINKGDYMFKPANKIRDYVKINKSKSSKVLLDWLSKLEPSISDKIKSSKNFENILQ